ncbi:HAMP domain-containing histidine kinase [Pedobacter aquae]|uniref:histidine kinase n=1 Tax=Pedobacter aquae TaxID=2605747 RepID=A0A5C0VH00_9SPHI|nr:HAMP domain-containing sensor histidine kinase [Pedobacter aquae]QEK51182.1 HAMP domain-containing histidine kinase [Pedobacter aquae]
MTIKKSAILFYLFFLFCFLKAHAHQTQQDNLYFSNLEESPVGDILDSLHHENNDLKKQNLSNELKIENRNSLIYVILIFSLTALFLSFRLYKSGRRAKTNNRILKEQNEEINKQKKELEELNNLKNRFFSIISHDVRGPLLSLKGTLNLFDEHLLDEKESKLLIGELKSQFNSTSNLLDNLLIWAKSQMQGEKLQKSHFNVLKVVKDNIALQKYNIHQKNIKIVVNVPDDLQLYADKEMVNVIIRNLLNNALKFTPQDGEIMIACTANGDMAQFSVQDNGIGLSPAEIKEIYKRNFYSTSGLNDEKGTGLGLILCQEFIRKNNGSFDIKSKKGQGSTFLFTLPLFKEVHVREASY